MADKSSAPAFSMGISRQTLVNPSSHVPGPGAYAQNSTLRSNGTAMYLPPQTDSPTIVSKTEKARSQGRAPTILTARIQDLRHWFYREVNKK